jgi:hypothetical protein
MVAGTAMISRAASDRPAGSVGGRPELTVSRLLQNPVGQPAPAGERGDLVCASDGVSKIYLTAAEYDAATEAHLRWLLAEQPHRSTGGGPSR